MSEFIGQNYHNGNGENMPREVSDQARLDKETLKSFAIPFEDPVVTRIIESARDIEQYINQPDVSEDEAKKQLLSLNKKWPYLNKRLIVSGKIWYPGEDSHERRDVDSQGYTSKGFWIQRKRKNIDGDHIEKRFICHMLVLPGIDKYIYGELDEVAITYPFVSTEYARTRLYYHYADIMNGIDEATSEAQTDVELLNYLKDLSLDTSNISSVERKEMQDDMGQYLTHMADLDIELPYIIAAQGTILTISESGSYVPKTYHESLRSIGKCDKVELMIKTHFSRDANDLNTLVPAIFFTQQLPERNTSCKLIIPLYSVSEITSQREMFYKNEGYEI